MAPDPRRASHFAARRSAPTRHLKSERHNRNPRPPYPPEFRERAVRMVLEHQGEYPSQWKAIQSIAEKLKVNHESLRIWVRKAETDAGARPGLTTDERAKMKELERENRRAAPGQRDLEGGLGFLRGELDPQPPR